MTLDVFLAEHALTAVQTLPDDRLINVVVDGGALYGVVVDDIPQNVPLTTLPATIEGTTITAGMLTFDTTLYTMLG